MSSRSRQAHITVWRSRMTAPWSAGEATLQANVMHPLAQVMPQPLPQECISALRSRPTAAWFYGGAMTTILCLPDSIVLRVLLPGVITVWRSRVMAQYSVGGRTTEDKRMFQQG